MVNGIKAVLTAVLCTMLVACGGSGDDFEPRELALESVSVFFGFTDLKETYVVRTDQEWERVWLLQPMQTSASVRPPVDFSRKMILGITQGTGPSGCDNLTIQSVIERKDEVVLRYRVQDITMIPPETGCTGGLVELTRFVIVERINKPVVFTKIVP